MPLIIDGKEIRPEWEVPTPVSPEKGIDEDLSVVADRAEAEGRPFAAALLRSGIEVLDALAPSIYNLKEEEEYLPALYAFLVILERFVGAPVILTEERGVWYTAIGDEDSAITVATEPVHGIRDAVNAYFQAGFDEGERVGWKGHSGWKGRVKAIGPGKTKSPIFVDWDSGEHFMHEPEELFHIYPGDEP